MLDWMELSSVWREGREKGGMKKLQERRKGWGSLEGKKGEACRNEATGLGQGFLKGGVLSWMGTELPFIGRRLPLGRSRSDGRCMQAGFIARLGCSLRRATTDN